MANGSTGSSSVVFVLDELRDIEDARVREQREALERRQAEDRARAAERVRLEAEQTRLAEEREALATRLERQRARELELAELRARAEAERRLHAERVAAELRRPPAAVAARRSPWPWLIAACAVGALAVGQGLQWRAQARLARSLAVLEHRERATPLPAAQLPVSPQGPAPTATPAPAVSAADAAVTAPTRARGAASPSRARPATPDAPTGGIPACDELDDPLGCLPP